MSDPPPDLRRRLRSTRRWLLALTALCLSLGCGLAWSLLGGRGPAPSTRPAGLDPELQEAALREFLSTNPNLFDSFPDPDVGRILQRDKTGGATRSNSLGLRESEFPMPKVPGAVRVVLLGDSYVYGYGIEAQDRLGGFLRTMLTERAGTELHVECLHVGVVSWNIRAEVEYLRRFLHAMQPDLVLHVVVANDLDDVGGVRGFGTQTRTFSPQVRRRANGVLSSDYPVHALEITQHNWLCEGLDQESRSRYRQAAADLGRLAAAVEGTGARYQLVNYWEVATMKAAKELLCTDLRDDQVLHLSSREFRGQGDIVVSRSDNHWNRSGNQAVARFLLGAILERDLLPELSLRDDPDARESFARYHAAGLQAAERSRARKKIDIATSMTFPCNTEQRLRQIHGGIDRKGRIAPYASLVLARDEGRELVVRGTPLPARELDGTLLTVFADEFEVAQVTLRTGQVVDLRVPLPAEVLSRDFFSVRFQASDYVYATDQQQTCHSFRLTDLAAE